MSVKPSYPATVDTGSPLYTGLVGAWLFNENSGTTVHDNAASPQDGTLSGSTTPSWTTGNFSGPALAFNGTSAYIELDTPAKLNLSTSEVTVVLWLKFTTVPTTGIQIVIMDGQSNFAAAFDIFVNGFSHGTVQIGWSNQTVTPGNATLADGTWVQVVAVRSGTTGAWAGTVYLNGASDNTGSTAVNPHAQDDTNIGQQASGGNFFGTGGGIIDHIFMWNRALTPTEISTLFSNPFAFYPHVTIAPSSLPNGDKSSPYLQTISASGTTGPYTFATTAGTLPTGVTLNATTGILSGTPTATGIFTFTITATDSLGGTGSQAYTVTINPALVISGPQLMPNALVGTSYNQTVTAAGGSG